MKYYGMILLGIVVYPIISSLIEMIANYIQFQTAKITVKSCYLQQEIIQIETSDIPQDSQVIGFQIPDEEEWSDEDYE